jgi:hypothetical protein
MNQQVIKAEPRDYHDVISKVAAVKSLTSDDVEKLQRMMTMQEELEKRQAATRYNENMSMAQGEMTRISKDSANPVTRSKYASLEALDEAIRPIYTKYGFSVSFNDETPDDRPDWLRLIALVSCGADTRRFTKWIPVSTTGIRGQQAMTPTHASVASVTYGRRTLLKMIFNLAEEDTDGNLGSRLARTGGYTGTGTEQDLPQDALRKTEAKLDADAVIEEMRQLKDHTALYAYGQANRPDYLKLFPPDRAKIDAEYRKLMDQFAEQQK